MSETVTLKNSKPLKFLVDEDLPRSTVKSLIEAGYAAVDVRDCGLRGKTDEEIFKYAQEVDAIVLTGDRGFGSIIRFPPGSYLGIVVANFPNEMSTSELNTRIAMALSSLSVDDLLGNLVIIDTKKIRIRRHTVVQ